MNKIFCFEPNGEWTGGILFVAAPDLETAKIMANDNTSNPSYICTMQELVTKIKKDKIVNYVYIE
jgi:hypothetical protein